MFRTPLGLFASLLLAAAAVAQSPSVDSATPSPTQRRIPRQEKPRAAALLGRVTESLPAALRGEGPALAGVEVAVTHVATGTRTTTRTTADGIFRLRALAAGEYEISLTNTGFEAVTQRAVMLNAGEVLVVEMKMPRTPTLTAPQPPTPEAPAEEISVYQEIIRRPDDIDGGAFLPSPIERPDWEQRALRPRVDRWNIPLPGWERYQRTGEYPYTLGRWYDPFNQNILKGDKPIFGQQVFFNFTGTAVSGFDIRRLPIPSGVASARPGSQEFFGKGRQIFFAQTLRLSFDLFRGDTSFRPIDWRFRVTPAAQINQIWTDERGVVNVNVQRGTDRTDHHAGLQEAFFEAKLSDLSPNFDFVSIRAGIQQFNSDFRGFIFTQEQPGVRLFGNLRANRMEYNAAYFHMMEKDTNSGLNSFRRRDQQVLIANLYYQDFLAKGYTAQVSYHFNKDDASTHFDENGFIVRPAAIGSVRPHDVRAHYIGITGNGHFGRINVSNAFYQILGFDSFNPVAGQRVDMNAQMGALELSIDKDWLRFRASSFFASGDKNPRDRIARGFDSIVEAQTFAGGLFSFFNREPIRLTGTNVPLTSPESFLPNFRTSKDEGQANYVNPGILLFNAGFDVELTTKMRAIINANYMRFHHTQVFEQLLFQSRIKNSIGTDYSLGIIYRPPLSENIVITGGVAALVPGTGLRQIYTSKTLVSGFAIVKFQF
jgi:hypothetical protein